jgi:hypothetical protein
MKAQRMLTLALGLVLLAWVAPAQADFELRLDNPLTPLIDVTVVDGGALDRYGECNENSVPGCPHGQAALRPTACRRRSSAWTTRW